MSISDINEKDPGAAYANTNIVKNGYILAVDADTETFLANHNLTYGPGPNNSINNGILNAPLTSGFLT